LTVAQTLRTSLVLPATIDPLIIVACCQSNGRGAAVDAQPEPVAVPHWARWEDERIGHAGLWEPCGPLSRDQILASANAGALNSALPTTSGIHAPLATALLGAGRTPAMITATRSGTPISRWLAAQPGQTHVSAVIAAAIADVIAKGSTITSVRLVHIHGEQDSTNGTSQGTYTTGLATVFAFLRGLGAGTPFASVFANAWAHVFKLNASYSGGGNAAIQAAQAAYPAGDAIGRASHISTDAYTSGTFYVSPHLLNAGYSGYATLLAADIAANP
jgi:hypothetical protein